VLRCLRKPHWRGVWVCFVLKPNKSIVIHIRSITIHKQLAVGFDWHRGFGFLWPCQFSLDSYRNHWALAALRCYGGCARNDRSCISFGQGMRRLLKKGSLSGIEKRNTSFHFYLLHPFFKLPSGTFSWRGSVLAVAVNALFLIAAAGLPFTSIWQHLKLWWLSGG